jgi:hypothetical protein
LKAITFGRTGGSKASRIRFLWSTLPVRTSGNPAVKRRRAAKTSVWPDFTGKCDAPEFGGDGSRHAYYCIARAVELWFERLDFDAF